MHAQRVRVWPWGWTGRARKLYLYQNRTRRLIFAVNLETQLDGPFHADPRRAPDVEQMRMPYRSKS